VSREPEREYHSEHDIVTESWAPIGKGGGLLGDPVIADMARALGRTPAQVVLRWHLQLGLIPIPKTARHERLALNLDVFDFSLGEAEMLALSALDNGDRGAVDSDTTGL
jgi:2,5-diketo-D-gluconate reductase A